MTEFPTITREVKTFMVYKACPECSTKPNPGCLLVGGNYAVLTNPAKVLHHCPNCNKEYWLDAPYPKIVYEEDKNMTREQFWYD